MSEPNTIRVLSKAVAILEELAATAELKPAELATRIGEPRSSVYRLLAALEEHGLVASTERNGAYEIGNHLCALGVRVLARFDDVRDAATPVIERVHAVTGQTVFVTVRRQFESICVARLDGELVNIMVQPIGGVMPLHAGASARILLAHESREFWQEFIRNGPLRRFTDKTETDPEKLIGELERILEQNYAISDEDVIPGIAAVGAAVLDRHGHPRASISLSGPRPAILENSEESIGLVIDAAAAISLRLDPLASPATSWQPVGADVGAAD